MEFNSDFRWPYGRRESIFPVWAHRRGVTYPRVVFQDGFDRDKADLARSVVRRTERTMVGLKETGKLDRPEGLTYMNRLACLLFTLARYAEKIH